MQAHEEDGNASGDNLLSEERVASGSQSQSLINSVFFFLSDANPPTLVAIIGGLVAVLYLFFGKLSLLFIGILSGVVLHIWWDDFEHAGDRTVEDRAKGKRRELGIEVANRLLSWQERQARHSVLSDATTSNGVLRDYSNFRSKTATALTTLTDAVIDSYVL